MNADKSLPSSNRFRGCLLGLAAGDAVGTSVEFCPRGSFEPLMDMRGGGPFGLHAGQWTDDTSMALCLAISLLQQDGFDPRDQMERYCRWWREGYLSSTGECFDIGNTVRSALCRFIESKEPYSGSTDLGSAGNGSLMRLAPIPMFFFPDHERVAHYATESSRTTHGTAECLDACKLFGDMLCWALAGSSKEEILKGPSPATIGCDSIRSIAGGDYQQKQRNSIQNTGYVVHSLEAALWCFWKTTTFEKAVLEAANLGGDADTIAAICGQIAGAFYGAAAIPERWLARLAMRRDITKIADLLHAASLQRGKQAQD
jgi:ADP-ribosyl-[dinitrogen reductase] hydrolase